ncbi:four helix bundle protein [Maribacter sp. ACAM166]|uniref:four helix bundle protein n=1 Tax=Maribacter sp. ACAM166 TaxID=2508996 RepID=UPI0010FE8D37|nr:four helix bundle protein [Maribacter sp. ACAM166]TLP78822.1 four helix bundle protein [Maribacter sp. ACAM166]
MKVYTELDVWKESRILVGSVYKLTRSFPKEELYGLTNQLRRCAVSIPSNIAEGCGRRTAADTIQFLHISRGSLYELETQLFIALDLNYISQEDFNNLNNRVISCKKLINGFINYFKSNRK